MKLNSAVLKVVIFLVNFTMSEACPPWTIRAESNTTQCKCGKQLDQTIRCNNKTLQVYVLRCYCITYNRNLNTTLIGRCLGTCLFKHHHSTKYNYINTTRPEMVNKEVCSKFNRDGQLCGNCIEGYGPPVYSYSLQCVKCDKSNFKYNLLKYIAVAFLPLTGFYLIVIVFKIRVTSSSMIAYVLTSQLFTAPFPSRCILTTLEITHNDTYKLIHKFLLAFLAFWNLDILRSVYSPFCIHPDMNTLQVLALDYLVGVYPLLLIAITYIVVMLHDRYPLVVRLWRPVNKLCMYIRREWDIRGSLVQAFATFLVLSYVKILNVSFDLLTPVSLLTPEGEYLNQSYLYNAGETPYFGQEHLPYGVLAVFMLTMFNALPVVLLFLYPCSCCHKCLNSCHLSRPALHTFMDAFQGCYHHKPRERRYFAALYFFVRVLELLTTPLFTDSVSYLIITAVYFILLGLTVILLTPYKSRVGNKRDAFFFLWYALGYILMIYYIADPQPNQVSLILSFLSFFTIPFIYFVAIIARIIIPKKLIMKLTFFYSKIIYQMTISHHADELLLLL